MTKAEIKLFQSLSQQKYRKEQNAYLVEGDKNAREWLLSDQKIKSIIATAAWASAHDELLQRHPLARLILAEPFELEKISGLKSAPQVIVVVEMPASADVPDAQEWTLFLERIQDPGNMGTLVRTADWFGIRQIICTPDCVSVFNPKVVQSSMGSLIRATFFEMDLDSFLEAHRQPLYATCLTGKPLSALERPKVPGCIAMGNESQGLSQKLIDKAEFPVTIPGHGGAESLNVGVAAGIVCYALRSM